MARMNLRSMRGSLCLTQEEMADRIGVSNQTYSLVELGKRRGSMSFWKGLQTAFNLPDAQMWQLMQEGELDETQDNENTAD